MVQIKDGKMEDANISAPLILGIDLIFIGQWN